MSMTKEEYAKCISKDLEWLEKVAPFAERSGLDEASHIEATLLAAGRSYHQMDPSRRSQAPALRGDAGRGGEHPDDRSTEP